jgi:hypothetical protein
MLCYVILTDGERGGAVRVIRTFAPDNGRMDGGFLVTITGVRLTHNGTSGVTTALAGVEAMVVFANDTVIVVNASAVAAPASGPVTVWSGAYGANFTSEAFTYNARGTITSVQPQRGYINSSMSVSIFGTDLAAAADDVVSLRIGSAAVDLGTMLFSAGMIHVTISTASVQPGSALVQLESVSRGLFTPSQYFTFVGGMFEAVGH